MITLLLFEKTSNYVILVKTGIQNLQPWIPAGVYPDENRGRNDKLKVKYDDLREKV
jgi:hypothetical protein